MASVFSIQRTKKNVFGHNKASREMHFLSFEELIFDDDFWKLLHENVNTINKRTAGR